MEAKPLRRNIFQRLFGISATSKAMDIHSWHFHNGKLTVNIKKIPHLRIPGTAVRIEGKKLPMRILLVHGEDKKYHAFQNRCAHIGHRRLDFVPGTSTVQCCSVGKSTYRFDGTLQQGPAPGPVLTYPVTQDGETITIDIT